MTAKVPFGVTLAGKAGSDRWLLALAGELHDASGLKDGAVTLTVCGAHLRGFPLHGELFPPFDPAREIKIPIS
jgi:hypothetical protein